MKRAFKVISILLVTLFLFSCNSVTTAQTVKLASDKQYTYDEVNKEYRALNLKYSKNREDFASDVVFANFRNVKVGNIKKDILYRGASPIDNSMGRAKYVDKLIREAGIQFDVDLSDNEDKVKRQFSKEDFASNYFKSLYDNNKTVCLHMSTNYNEQKYHERIVKAMVAMSKNEGPYYVHCVEGKNRTGFLLAVIEGLAGASYEEMVRDHMITFANYYGITEESDKEKYDIIKARYIDSVLRYIADNDPWTGNGTIELKDLDWVNIMGRYLQKNGMSDEDIHNWYTKLTDDNYKEDTTMEYDRIEYLGHGSLKLLLKDGKVCYIDPYAGNDYKEKGDLILITHEHNDHTKIELVPNYKDTKIIRSADCFGPNGYNTFDILGMHIEPVEAYNKNHDIKKCVGYVITSNGKKIYVAGDTSTTNQMQLLSSYNIDYAFLPMDGIYNMDIDEAIECEKIIKAKHTIPYHMAPGELFNEERANKFKTPTTLIIRPNDIIDIK